MSPAAFLRSPRVLGFVAVAGVALLLEASVHGLSRALALVHPLVLGALSVAITLWFLRAVAPYLTYTLIPIVENRLPSEDPAHATGLVVRVITVLGLPSLCYFLLMSLRGTSKTWVALTYLVLLLLLLYVLALRSADLLSISWDTFPEDEVRKGLYQSGTYNETAKQKLRDVIVAIRREVTPDRKRIRLQKLALVAQALRNRNIDPRQIEGGVLAAASLADLDREGAVAWKKKSVRRLGKHGRVEDTKLDAEIAEHKARARYFDSRSVGRRPSAGKSLDDELDDQLTDEVGIEEAGDRVLKKKRRGMETEGLPKEEIDRRMGRLEAKLAEIIARRMSEE